MYHGALLSWEWGVWCLTTYRRWLMTKVGKLEFLCRDGNIERRHQLQVIRLSGMNLVVNDLDMPLIIKV
jgi:hypothetical protein